MNDLPNPDLLFVDADNGGAAPAATGDAASGNANADGAAPTAAANGTAPAAVGEVETAADSGLGKQEGRPQPQGNVFGEMMPIFLIIAAFFVLMMVMNSRSRKKQVNKMKELHSSLKRDDEIMLQNGKFVVVDKVEKNQIYVFADLDRRVRERYHINAVSMRASEADSAGTSATGGSPAGGESSSVAGDKR